MQLIAANQKISAAEELHLSVARDSKERADATFLSQMQAEVRATSPYISPYISPLYLPFLSQMQAEVRHRAATHPNPNPNPNPHPQPQPQPPP